MLARILAYRIFTIVLYLERILSLTAFTEMFLKKTAFGTVSHSPSKRLSKTRHKIANFHLKICVLGNSLKTKKHAFGNSWETLVCPPRQRILLKWPNNATIFKLKLFFVSGFQSFFNAQ